MNMSAFNSHETRILARAFERAWDRFLRAGGLTPYNLISSRELLARRIIESAQRGERDEWRLARDAVLHLHRGER
jgi:hypothetical protein